jgi:two-component sensor histidine kinase
VHHRVKNNMQVISSLLDLQAAQIDDAETSRMLLESTARVQLMALVHQRLYSTEDLDRIDLGSFIQEVVPDLVQMYRDPRKAISVSIQADCIETDMDCAILCGLIVNETLSNALKHAFPDRKEGCVQITVGRNTGGHLTLRVSDDGVGLPQEFDLRQSQTLGMQLIYSLSRQLRASVEVDTGKGTAFTITFHR